ncbi:methylmalonyl-CoA epimerase [Seinonella peptonophila]|uniref:Methylmalonyl-CoA epimerase n=1 Tax=Seinonella peptonophila TaxID=112248 RepID=A0A1M5AAT8_9BACL|nr:methylmalonyl-CoA epimerase [Seinonella peptonophila]SHF27430.1 methylmalonyl-CoA epimerase [Seinonella peptonophila]
MTITIHKLDHIAIIVENLEKALLPYTEALGLIHTPIEYIESHQVRVTFIPLGQTQIELIEPLNSHGKLARFLQKTGGGLHHVAIEVANIEDSIRDLQTHGIEMNNSHPQPGAQGSLVAFTKRRSFDGVIIELIQKHS